MTRGGPRNAERRAVSPSCLSSESSLCGNRYETARTAVCSAFIAPLYSDAARGHGVEREWEWSGELEPFVAGTPQSRFGRKGFDAAY
jgi:hypothetical protein